MLTTFNMEDQINECFSRITSQIYNINRQQEPLGFSEDTDLICFFLDMKFQIESVVADLEIVTDSVIQMIMNWKHSKRYEEEWKWQNCSKIQNWMDSILTHSLNLWDRMKQFENMYYELEGQNMDQSEQKPVNPLLDKTEQMISKLLNAAFFLETHPPRFVKEKLIMTLKFRHLMGNRLLLEPGLSPTISLLNNKEVDFLLQNQMNHFRSALDSISGHGVLEKHEAEILRDEAQNGQLVLNFAKVQVLKPGRVRPSEADSVKDEKFCFLCEMIVGYRPELKIKVWTLSQPLICGTHGNQKTRSMATIAWDNILCSPNRTTLAVAQEIGWPILEAELDRIHKFYAEIPLSDLNKKHLRARLIPPHAVDNNMVTFKAFCVDHMPGTNFTFWEWFSEGLKFGAADFKEMWRDGYVIGFLGREDADKLLTVCNQGTFLIRFSESVRTAITITWRHLNGAVYSVGPFKKESLEGKKLPETISDMERSVSLSHFYPNNPISVLSNYLSTERVAPVPRGYIPVYRVVYPEMS